MKIKQLFLIFFFEFTIFSYQNCNAKFDFTQHDHEKFCMLIDQVKLMIPNTYQAFLKFLAHSFGFNKIDDEKIFDKLIENCGLQPNLLNRYLFLLVFVKSVAKFGAAYDLKSNPFGKSDKYEELFNQVLISFEQLSEQIQKINSEKNKKNRRYFKKRYLLGLLFLLPIIAFNINLHRKMSQSQKDENDVINDFREEYDEKIRDAIADCNKNTAKVSDACDQKVAAAVQECKQEVNGAVQNCKKESDRVVQEYDKKISDAVVDCNKKIEGVSDACDQKVKVAVQDCKKDCKQESDKIVQECKKEREKTLEKLRIHTECIENMFAGEKKKEESWAKRIFSLDIDFLKAFKIITRMVSVADAVGGTGQRRDPDLEDFERRFEKLQRSGGGRSSVLS